MNNDVTLTQETELDRELTRKLSDGSSEHFGTLLLRGADNQLRGVALLRHGSESVPTLRTEGLATMIAEALAKFCGPSA